MRFHFLGTGGATITPRPACSCCLCCEARAKGLPYSRWGPALFEETLAILDAVGPGRAVLTHVEHMNARSHDDLLAIERQLGRYRLMVAYDGLVAEV